MSNPKSKKSSSLDDATKKPILMLTVAAVALALGLVAANYFFKSLDFHRQVFSKKNAVESQLKSNEKAFDKLEKSFVVLEKSGPKSEEIFRVLPTSKDLANTTLSLESIAQRSGMQIKTVALDNNGAVQSEAEYAVANPEVTPMVLSLETQGTYSGLVQLLKNIDKSKRIYRIDGVDISGSTDSIRALITLTTYYKPAVDNSIETEGFSL